MNYQNLLKFHCKKFPIKNYNIIYTIYKLFLPLGISSNAVKLETNEDSVLECGFCGEEINNHDEMVRKIK